MNHLKSITQNKYFLLCLSLPFTLLLLYFYQIPILANSHSQTTITNIIIEKVWLDQNNQDGIRPESVEFQLLKNGSLLERKTVTASEGWSCAFCDLPMKDSRGNEITYSVTESSIPGYSTSMEKKSSLASDEMLLQKDLLYTFSDTHISMTLDLPVRVSWNDARNHDQARPDSVRIQLYLDGSPYGGAAILDEENLWTFQFTGLPVYQNGKLASYHIEQASLPKGYTSDITGEVSSGFLITNTYTVTDTVSADCSEMKTISGSISWDDHSDQDGIRPDFLEVQLLADNNCIARQIVSEANAWIYTFDHLPEYSNGEEIHYSIHTETPSQYELSEKDLFFEASGTCVRAL